jgi:phage tail-like protein
MRGGLDLLSPHPLGPSLPAIFQEDDFAMRLAGGFDVVLAPVLASIDNLDAYIDSNYAPEDFLDWLATWVGLAVDETWELTRRRALVARAVELYRVRGTLAGLASLVELVTAGTVELVDNGGTSWSTTTGSTPPGSAQPGMAVRVRVKDPKAVDVARLDRLVGSAKPAHVPHVVEVVKG